MRIALRLAAAALVLLVVLAVAIVLLVPRLLSSEAAEHRLQAAARDAVGREVRWQDLRVALFPPRLVVSGVDLLDPDDRQEVALRAARIDLKVAWLPLLARQVVIDSLVLEGIELGMVRTPEGLELPVGLVSREDRRAAAAPKEGAAAAEGIALAVREFRVVDAVLRLVDRSVSPAVTWELRDLGLEFEARALDQPVEFTARGALASGGRLSAVGSVVLGGPLQVALELREIALAPFRPYLGEVELDGLASGQATLSGSAGVPEAVTATLELTGGRIGVDELRATGPVSLAVSVEQLTAPRGSFQLDAGRAELVYGSAFHKAPGTEAKASGTFRTAPDGDVEVDVERLKIKNASGAGSAALAGARVHVGLSLDPFELDGWQALIPALAPYAPRGRIAVPKLQADLAPLRLRGRAELNEVQLTPPGRPPVTLRGALVARGERLDSEDLTVMSAGQTIPVAIGLNDLGAAPRYTLGAGIEGAEANDILTTFANLPDALYGILNLRADVAGPLAAEAAFAETLRGKLALRVEPGRLRGVSLLRSVLGELGTVGDAALLLGALRGGQTLQRFYGDDFEVLAGTFALGDGRARTEDLHLVYRNYRVDLRGALGLADQSLDFAGTLTIEPEVQRALIGQEAAAAATPPRAARVIPLAAVKGTLSEPRIRITAEAARSFVAFLRAEEGGGATSKLESKIDKELGEGTGKAVLDALGGLLGLPPPVEKPEAGR